MPPAVDFSSNIKPSPRCDPTQAVHKARKALHSEHSKLSDGGGVGGGAGAGEAGALSFKAGDMVRFTGVEKDGWVNAESRTGEVGKVPVEYFDRV